MCVYREGVHVDVHLGKVCVHACRVPPSGSQTLLLALKEITTSRGDQGVLKSATCKASAHPALLIFKVRASTCKLCQCCDLYLLQIRIIKVSTERAKHLHIFLHSYSIFLEPDLNTIYFKKS